MVNSAGSAPIFLPSDPTQPTPSPSSLLASVAAGRPDLVYSELYKNLFKTVGKLPIEGTNSLREKELNVGKLNLPDPQKSPNPNVDLHKNSKFPRHDFTNPISTHSPLRSFYEGIYNRITPNDYLLRLRAEQQFAANNSELRRKTPLSQTHTYPIFPNQQRLSLAPERGSAFSRTDKNHWAPSTQFLRSSFHQSPHTAAQKGAPDSDITSSSPTYVTPSRHSESSVSPLDFRLQKSHGILPSPSDSTTSNFNSNLQTSVICTTVMKPTRDEETNLTTSTNGTKLDKNGHITAAQNEPTPLSGRPELSKAEVTSRSSDVIRISPSLQEPRLKRKRRLTSSAETCPICGVTVRSSEMKQHYQSEVARLEKIAYDVFRSSRKVYHDKRASGPASSCNSNHPGTSVTPTTSKKQSESDGQQAHNKENRLKTFQKVCGNRIDRFNSRVGQCQSSMWRDGMVGGYPAKLNGAPWVDYNRNVMAHNKTFPLGGRFEGVRCPVCDASLSHLTNHDEISDHVIQCAGSSSSRNGELSCEIKNEPQETEEVDVVDDGHFGEEYEWCGETRVRATALLHRKTLESSPGFQVIRNTEHEDSDQDLNVETDETCEYGAAQFNEGDLIPPCASDGEVGTSSQSQTSPCPPSTSHSVGISSSSSSYAACQSPSIVVQALRLKIQELESGKQHCRCLICMEPYTKPLVSIQCWHVHCETCWMRALGVKKLCPQCNMITPASQLRRIYL